MAKTVAAAESLTPQPLVTKRFSEAARAVKDGEHVYRIDGRWVVAGTEHKARLAAADALLGKPVKVPLRDWAQLLLDEQDAADADED